MTHEERFWFWQRLCVDQLFIQDLQINNVTPVMELREQLVGKKLSDQILK